MEVRIEESKKRHLFGMIFQEQKQILNARKIHFKHNDIDIVQPNLYLYNVREDL